MKNLILQGLKLGQKVSKGFRKWLKDKMDKCVNCAKSVMQIFELTKLTKLTEQIFAESAESAKSAKSIYATSATYASANFVGKASNESTVMDRVKSRIPSCLFRYSLDPILSRFSLVSLICLCMLTIGSGNVWGAAPTLSDLTFSTESSVRIVNEDFSSASATDKTAKMAANTSLSGFGAFNKGYNNSTSNHYAIESSTFSSNALKITMGSTSPCGVAISGKTFGTTGAWRIKTTKSSRMQIGIYAEGATGTVYAKANASVWIKNDAGSIAISKNASSSWQSVGSSSNTYIDICVIYNNTSSATTYGNGINLGGKKAHVYIDGTCIMNGENPKAFDIPGSNLTAFRVYPIATSGYVACVDDIQIWNALPTAAATTTVTASPTSITFANNTLNGSGEASGSSTVDLSVSNGNKSAGNYLWVVVESDNEDDCEFTINSGAYSYGSGNNTSIDDLSVEYYAISAGTWDGRIIAQGYNSSYEAVNCTIPLRVTIAAPACANSVTINKGTETNCSFTLSKSGSQASCDGVSTTVTVTPNTGYGTPSVTQSGASKTPTITGSGTSWTVTYPANTTSTSTINVSCSANNYTITLDKDLTPTTAGTPSIIATYNSNNNLTDAITPPTKTDWTFAGYFTEKNGGGTQIIDANGNVLANANDGGSNTYTDASRNWKYANNITLYAKWTCTVTWSVNGLTNVYSTQTVTYNSSGCKVASVPDGEDLDLENDYCGDIFAGWSRKNAGTESKTTTYYDDLFKNVAGSPDLKSIGDVTFYAVFADED